MFTNLDCDCFFVADRSVLIKTLSVLPEYLRYPVPVCGANAHGSGPRSASLGTDSTDGGIVQADMNQSEPGAVRFARRAFLQKAGAAVAGWAILPQLSYAQSETAVLAPAKAQTAGEDLIAAIERAILWNGRKSGKTWFHPRACLIPSGKGVDKPIVFMTMQEIIGSDVFGQVHWTLSTDLGRTWCEPEPIPAFVRGPIEGSLEEGVCDVVPQFHPPSGVVLAMGHNVYYKAGKLMKPQEDRFPVYAIRTPDGHWTERKRLRWDDPRGSGIYTCGCGERLLMNNGDVLAAISFAPKGQANRKVMSFRCAFDGRDLTIREVGNELVNPARRGFLEPSLTRWRGEYFMTLRAEDDHGYVARSDDGLQWAKPQPWMFDDGEPLVMSTTQQHWLPHSDRLHLIYTRKTKNNGRVMRWRSPLFVAAVEAKTLRLIRATERVVFPLDNQDTAHVARLGNFHPLMFSPLESWVTTGEERPADGWKGDLLLARIRWSKPTTKAD
jgi:hypothetical protein